MAKGRGGGGGGQVSKERREPYIQAIDLSLFYKQVFEVRVKIQ